MNLHKTDLVKYRSCFDTPQAYRGPSLSKAQHERMLRYFLICSL